MRILLLLAFVVAMPTPTGSNRSVVLLYGFGPYGNFTHNVSQEAIEKIKSEEGVVKVILSADLSEKDFIALIERVKPAAIIGLGQWITSSRTNEIRIEKCARNLRYQSWPPQDEGNSIEIQGPDVRCNSPIPEEEDGVSYLSDDAGLYTCNFSMYVAIRYSQIHHLKYAFFHIPPQFGADRATKFVEDKINIFQGPKD